MRPRPVVHWEITAVDAEAQRAFCAALFNWEIGEGPIMNIAAGPDGPEPGPAGPIRESGEPGEPGVALHVQAGHS